MGINQPNIFIITDKENRAESIRGWIQEAKEEINDISTLSASQLDEFDRQTHTILFIIDLTSINKPSGLVINQIKKKSPDSKIIALHIYRSPMLVNPLFEMGVNGYLYHKPAKEQLATAIEKVFAGSMYKPEFL